MFLIAILLLSFTGCGNIATSKSNKLQIICTIFPQYDWVRNILGEHADNTELTLLMDNGADLHNYQATVSDLVAISACDLFIYVGGESDAWTMDALKDPTNQSRKTLALMDVVDPLKVEEHHEEEHDHEEEHEHQYDEHVWLSLKTADKAIAEITEMLAELDPDHAADYRENADEYRKSIQELDQKYQDCVDTAVRKTILFADRFPFLYLANDYDLEYEAAFSGCSAETEASFSTLTRLVETVNEHKLPVVLVIETSDRSIAETVVSSTKTKDQEILVVDSIQSVTQNRIDDGETYLNIMEKNLTILEKALH